MNFILKFVNFYFSNVFDIKSMFRYLKFLISKNLTLIIITFFEFSLKLFFKQVINSICLFILVFNLFIFIYFIINFLLIIIC